MSILNLFHIFFFFQIIIMNDASPRTKLKKHLVSRGAEIPVYWSSKVNESIILSDSMKLS